MENVLLPVLLAVGGYLLGSCNASIILSRKNARYGDVRARGSGNAGATNMARSYGWVAGLLTLALDFLKALLAVGVGAYLFGDTGVAVCGFACLVGHCYPLYFGFRGGKGISVGAALALAIDWRVLAVVVGVFLVGALLSRRVSAGSVLAAVAVTAAALLFHVSSPKLVLSVLGSVLVLFRHRANIRRLLNGTEPAFHAAKKNESKGCQS